MSTRYSRETGQPYNRFAAYPRRDTLEFLSEARQAPTRSAYHQNQYMPARRRAYRPVLGQLRMIEAAIRCGIVSDNAVAAWREAMA